MTSSPSLLSSVQRCFRLLICSYCMCLLSRFEMQRLPHLGSTTEEAGPTPPKKLQPTFVKRTWKKPSGIPCRHQVVSAFFVDTTAATHIFNSRNIKKQTLVHLSSLEDVSSSFDERVARVHEGPSENRSAAGARLQQPLLLSPCCNLTGAVS